MIILCTDMSLECFHYLNREGKRFHIAKCMIMNMKCERYNLILFLNFEHCSEFEGQQIAWW